MSQSCLSCHVQGGWSSRFGSRFVLAHPSEPNYLDRNVAAVDSYAAPDESGLPAILAKATNTTAHGGGQIFTATSTAYRSMADFIARTNIVDGCDLNIDDSTLSGLVMLDEGRTVAKAAVHLAQRLPSSDEAAMAPKNLDAALGSVLSSDAFGAYIMRVIDDTYLTAGANINNVGTDIYLYDDNICPDYCATVPATGQVVYRGCQAYWYNNNKPSGVAGVNDHDVTQRALTQTALQRVRYLVQGGKDYREVLTANYMLLNPWSARSLSSSFSYDLLNQVHWKNINDPNEFQPIVVDRAKWPTVGLLTDEGFLKTFSTTSTNRNRKRAHFIYEHFLGLDILTLAQRPSNLNAILLQSAADPKSQPPYMVNPACTICHSLIDPLAQNFSAYNDNINFSAPADSPNGPYGPYPMSPAGFEMAAEPADAAARGPRWLAEQIVEDPRFPRAQVRWWFTILTGMDPLGDAPTTTTNLPAYLAAQRFMDGEITRATDAFVAAGYNMQVAIRAILASPFYRAHDLAANLPADTQAMLEPFVATRWSGPDLLNDKLLATTGTTLLSQRDQWNGWGFLNQPLVRDYEGLLGGIDAMANVTQLNAQPTGIKARIATLAASQVACQLVAQEFAMPAGSRKLLGGVEPQVGLANAADTARVKAALAAVYAQITGAQPDEMQEDLAAAFELFSQTLHESAGQDLPTACRPVDTQTDSSGAIHAWISALAFAISDPRVLLQ